MRMGANRESRNVSRSHRSPSNINDNLFPQLQLDLDPVESRAVIDGNVAGGGINHDVTELQLLIIRMLKNK